MRALVESHPNALAFHASTIRKECLILIHSTSGMLLQELCYIQEHTQSQCSWRLHYHQSRCAFAEAEAQQDHCPSVQHLCLSILQQAGDNQSTEKLSW